MKVYCVTTGSYSSYCVEAIFSTMKKAKAYKEIFNCDGIYSTELDPNGVDLYNQGLRVFLVIMDRDGKTELVNQVELHGSITESPIPWKRSKIPVYKKQGLKDAVRGCVWAKDMQHAVKIVNELRVQFIAGNKL